MENVRCRSQLVLASVVAALVLALSPQPARAQAFWGTAAWSVVGSTGIADESSTSIVAFDNTGGVAVKPTAPAGSVVVVRYPVSFLPSHAYDINTISAYTFNNLRLTMTFRKPDDGSYASATLKRVRVSDGAVFSVASVNTFGSAAAAAAQQAEKTINCGEDVACINPYEYAYYIEVVLWKPESTNNPQVVSLRVYTSIS